MQVQVAQLRAPSAQLVLSAQWKAQLQQFPVEPVISQLQVLNSAKCVRLVSFAIQQQSVRQPKKLLLAQACNA